MVRIQHKSFHHRHALEVGGVPMPCPMCRLVVHSTDISYVKPQQLEDTGEEGSGSGGGGGGGGGGEGGEGGEEGEKQQVKVLMPVCVCVCVCVLCACVTHTGLRKMLPLQWKRYSTCYTKTFSFFTAPTANLVYPSLNYSPFLYYFIIYHLCEPLHRHLTIDVITTMYVSPINH